MAAAAAPQPTEARACHMTSDPTGPAVMATVCPTPAARFHPRPTGSMALSKVFCELPSLALPDCTHNMNVDPTAVRGAGSVLRVLGVTPSAERKGHFPAVFPGRQTVPPRARFVA